MLCSTQEDDKHVGNTEEENNGYVVFKWKTMHGSAGK